jgi:hypothetical protein
MRHKILGFCARWGRERIENLRVLCLSGMGVYREPPGFVLGGDRLAGRHRRRAIARRLRRARVRGALCGGPPPRAAVACGGAGWVFCLGGRLARPGVISRSGPAQKPTPPEDNSAAGL